MKWKSHRKIARQQRTYEDFAVFPIRLDNEYWVWLEWFVEEQEVHETGYDFMAPGGLTWTKLARYQTDEQKKMDWLQTLFHTPEKSGAIL